MRRPTEAEAHRARSRLIDGEYPEDMQARCALCATVAPISQGRMVELKVRSDGPARVFLCRACAERLSTAA